MYQDRDFDASKRGIKFSAELFTFKRGYIRTGRQLYGSFGSDAFSMVEQHYSDGDFIFRSGEASDGVYRVRSGGVRAVSPHASAVKGGTVYLPGDIFGERGFLMGDERPYGAVAEGDVSVDFLKRNECGLSR